MGRAYVFAGIMWCLVWNQARAADDVRTILAQAHAAPSLSLQVTSTKIAPALFSPGEALEITLTPDSATRFRAFTTKAVGKVSELSINGKVVAQPRISSPIVEGRVTLTGMLSSELRALAEQLSAPGALIVVRVLP